MKLKYFVRKITWVGGFFNHGFGCGYVVLPKEHPCFKMDYEGINVDVHGGLTFSTESNNLIGKESWEQLTDEDKDCWVVGFDTCHWDDNESNWSEKAVILETKSLSKQLEAYLT